MKNKTIKISLTILLCYLIYDYLSKNHFSDIRDWINLLIGDKTISRILAYSIVIIPLLVGTAVIHKSPKICRVVGLDKSVLQGVVLAFVGTLPMLIGFLFLFKFSDHVSIRWIIWAAVAAGFFEELIFRGIFFGQIFRDTKIGFIPAIVIGAILFALGHLYQSQELGTIVGVFLTTFLGAVLFAWLFVEWNYNLWVSISLHFFMNLYWILFAVSDNAFGNITANLFRVASVVLIIVLTVFYKRKRKLKLEIGKKNMIVNSSNA